MIKLAKRTFCDKCGAPTNEKGEHLTVTRRENTMTVVEARKQQRRAKRATRYRDPRNA